MSRKSELRKKADRLQNELNQVRSAMNLRLDEYQRDTDSRIAQLNRNMQNALRQHDKETENRYYKLLNDFQRDIVAGHNREMNALKKQYSNLQNELAEVTRELEEENRKIKNEISQLKNDIETEKRNNMHTSSESIRNLTKTYREVEKLPHEAFFPNKFSTYENYIISTRELHEKGMYNASVSLADSGRTMLELFRCDIENKSEEWKTAFANYCSQVEFTRKYIYSADDRKRKFENCSYDFSEEKIFDYWSMREYAKLIRKLQSHIDFISEIKKQGIENYIKNDPISIDEIEMRINELSYMIHQYNKISEFAFCNAHYFYIRTLMTDMIIDYMENAYNLFVSDDYADSASNGAHNHEDYRYMYEKFIRKDGYSVRNPDYRERYVIKMKNNNSDSYNFYIVPENLNMNLNSFSSFSTGIKNVIYYQVSAANSGTSTAIDEIYNEINREIEKLFSEEKFGNYEFIPVRSYSDKNKLSDARLHFSSELSNEEKRVINNNNMTWQSAGH